MRAPLRRMPWSDAPERFLSEQGCRELLARVTRMRSGGGEVELFVRSTWRGNLRWARNAVISSGDTTSHEIRIARRIRGASGEAWTNDLTDEALQACVRRAELYVHTRTPNVDALPPRQAEHYSSPQLWSDATFAVDALARGAVQRQLVEPAIAANLLAAGYLEVTAIGNGFANSAGLFAYTPQTRAEYSVTVRNAKGTGSGWAGTEHLDWRHIDAPKLSAIALEKCQQSTDPVAIEPGRYTVILEPQAVAEFLLPLVRSFARPPAERRIGPWADLDWPVDPILIGRARWGQHVLDARMTIRTDPNDPDAPYVPFASDGTPMRATTWVEEGQLTALAYGRDYALDALNQIDPLNPSDAFRMTAGPTSVPEMIASTERGLLVTRFVNVQTLFGGGLCTGLTSDGLWLIEKGKITKPVKNFRFLEVPFVAFNNVEAVGPTARVLMAQPTIVPAMKIRDFNMSRLADAV